MEANPLGEIPAILTSNTFGFFPTNWQNAGPYRRFLLPRTAAAERPAADDCESRWRSRHTGS